MANSTARLVFTLFWLVHANAWTQAIPDAGSVRQQIEQPRALPLMSAPVSRPAAPVPELKARTGLNVNVTEFRFVGNTLVPAEQLAAAVRSYLNRPIGFEDLQRAVDAVAAAYREAGWVVRAYLPEQDISAGTVTLQVIEAQFAGMRIESEPSKRVMRSELDSYISKRQKLQQPLSAHAIDRALLILDDLPGISVAGTLAPGVDAGQTVLALQTTDEPFIYGDVGLDNTGARATGSHRLSVNLSINSPGGRGELLSLSALHTQGSDYGRVALTVPNGHNGLRLGANATSMRYKVVEGPGANTAEPIQGRSHSMGLEMNYPVVRARSHNLYVSGGAENKAFTTQSPSGLTDYESYSARFGLSGNQFDDLGGGGANSASVQWTQGLLSGVRTQTSPRHFSKINYSFSRQQTLAPEHSLLLSLVGQHAAEVLDSSEKFYIGGVQTVRAYPASEMGGERGQVLSSEWRWRMAPVWVLTGFVDLGRVVNVSASKSMDLRGHGMSLGWQGPMGLSARLTWSHRMGRNPMPTSSGTDGDGTLKLDRWWFTTTLPF